MKDDSDSKDVRSKPETNSAELEDKLTINKGRRRIAKFGLATPVIITLVSRPVWGRECTWSQFDSGNLSDIRDTGEECQPPTPETLPQ